MTDEAISPLRRRMIEVMTIRKLAPNWKALTDKSEPVRSVLGKIPQPCAGVKSHATPEAGALSKHSGMALDSFSTSSWTHSARSGSF
jgi:hypothetical protein